MSVARFFRIVWRANALVILWAGLLVSAVAVMALAIFWKEQTGTREVRGVVNIAGAEVEQEKFRFGSFEPMEGLSLLRAPLTSEQQYDQVAFSKSGYAVRNYLFFDPETRSSRWLLPGNEQLFLVEDDLFFPPRSYDEPNEGRFLGTLLLVVERDTNGDDRLNDQDVQSLAVASADGRNYKIVAKDIGDYHGRHMISADEVLVFLTEAGVMKAASIDLATLALRWSEPLQEATEQEVRGTGD